MTTAIRSLSTETITTNYLHDANCIHFIGSKHSNDRFESKSTLLVSNHKVHDSAYIQNEPGDGNENTQRLQSIEKAFEHRHCPWPRSLDVSLLQLQKLPALPLRITRSEKTEAINAGAPAIAEKWHNTTCKNWCMALLCHEDVLVVMLKT